MLITGIQITKKVTTTEWKIQMACIDREDSVRITTISMSWKEKTTMTSMKVKLNMKVANSKWEGDITTARK
jgi:hypothetical protein